MHSGAHRGAASRIYSSQLIGSTVVSRPQPSSGLGFSFVVICSAARLVLLASLRKSGNFDFADRIGLELSLTCSAFSTLMAMLALGWGIEATRNEHQTAIILAITRSWGQLVLLMWTFVVPQTFMSALQFHILSFGVRSAFASPTHHPLACACSTA